MKTQKSIFAILITISMIFSFVACNKKVIYIDESNADESESDHITDSSIDESESDHITDSSIDESQSDTEKSSVYYPPVEERDYSIECIDGKYYFVFEQPERYIGKESEVSFIWRENWEELRYDLLYGELSKFDKAVIGDVFFDKDGNMSIEIPDFYNFYGPVTPEDVTVDGDLIIQRGKYGMNVTKDSGQCFYFYILTESEYDRMYEHHNNLNANDNIISYTLEDKNKFIEVLKKYHNGNLTNICLFGTQNGRYFYASMAMHFVTEKPTDEWLLSFGLELYASENE